MTSSVDDLIAVADAARAYIQSLAAAELPPGRVFSMARTASARSAALLARCGHGRVSPRTTLASRDDTDELIGRALGDAFDDGPEGPGESGALVTEETGEVPLVSGLDSLVQFDDEPVEQPEPPRHLPDDDEVTLKSPEPTVKSEDMPPLDEETLESFDLVGDDATPPGGLQAIPFNADDVADDPSVQEVIVTKEDAVREVEALRASLPPGSDTAQPEDAAATASDALEDLEDTADEAELPEDAEPTAEVEARSASVATDTDVPAAVVAAPRAAPAPKVRVVGNADQGGAAFYGAAGAVPTIRDGSTPKPRAAAIQLGVDGGESTVLGDEEELEPIAVGGVEDEDDYDFDSDQGFGLHVEEYEEYEDDEPEDELPEPPVEPQPVALPTVDVPTVLEQAAHAVKSGDLERGIDLYSDVLDVEPENIVALIGRGRIQLDLGDFARAMSDFTVAQEVAPDDPEPRIAIGDLYFARKDYRRAIELFDSALEASPDHAMAYCRRGISHYYRKNYKDANDDLTRAKRLDPDIPNINTYVAMAKKRLRK